jgi:hypothetical protein
MQNNGSLHVDCGSYNYAIHSRPNPEPTSAVKCFPRPKPEDPKKPHDNPDTDMLLKIADLDVLGTCESQSTNLVCRACNPRWDVWRPIYSNFYESWFQKDDAAPAECAGIQKPEEEIGTWGVKMCVTPYERIIKECPWNGGEVKTVCGTFAVQNCPNGGDNCTLGKRLEEVYGGGKGS